MFSTNQLLVGGANIRGGRGRTGPVEFYFALFLLLLVSLICKNDTFVVASADLSFVTGSLTLLSLSPPPSQPAPPIPKPSWHPKPKEQQRQRRREKQELVVGRARGRRLCR